MAAQIGSFDETANPTAVFDASAVPEGWFDEVMIPDAFVAVWFDMASPPPVPPRKPELVAY